MKALTPLLLLVLIAAGSGEPPGTVVLTGRVTVRGSEPHTIVVIASAERGDVQLSGRLAGEIRSRHQGRILEVRCRIVREALGPGFPAEAEVLKILKAKD
jgi:hypothetical protein